MADDSSFDAVQDRAGPAQGGRLLLVEDNQINQIVALGILGQLGYTVDMAGDGEQALAMGESNEYLAVFLDVQLPDLDGFEVARRWRERENGRHTPIIAMTTGVRPGDRERCLAAGMDDYVAKPIRRDTVTTSLSRWFGEPVDEEQIEELRRGTSADRAALAERIQTFLTETPALLDDLAGAVARGESAALPLLAHGLKTTASTLGATGLTELAGSIATQGRDGDLPGATATLVRLRAEFDRAAGDLGRIAAG